MSDFGVTTSGVNIKRLDTILKEIHGDLSAGYGFNTQQDPQSFLGVLVTNFSDKIAELWEFGKQIYDAMNINSAEGINLDYVAQLGGAVRNMAAKSYYPVHCTGLDGTVLGAGTMIASNTNPVTQLTLSSAKTISRAACNQAVIKLANDAPAGEYFIAINGIVYRYAAQTGDTVSAVLKGIAGKVLDTDFTVSVDADAGVLSINAVDPATNYPVTLSEGLTTVNVTTVITFVTEEYGDIVLPNGTITRIVQANPGLAAVTNRCGYVAGRKRESDVEFRANYASRIFARSSRMARSIESAILANVQGVSAVSCYENDGNTVDEAGRPPHSIEVIVAGGDTAEIAQQILNSKAAGIQTFGSIEVEVPDAYGGSIAIRFNRPAYVYCWFSVKLTLSSNEALPPNYVELIEAVIKEKMAALIAGTNVTPQRWLSDLYKACSGIDYIDITVYKTTDSEDEPTDSKQYTLRSVTIEERQKAVTDSGRIEVLISNA